MVNRGRLGRAPVAASTRAAYGSCTGTTKGGLVRAENAGLLGTVEQRWDKLAATYEAEDVCAVLPIKGSIKRSFPGGCPRPGRLRVRTGPGARWKDGADCYIPPVSAV